MKKSTLVLIGFLLMAGNYAFAQYITVAIAGNGFSGSLAIGLPALRTSVNFPRYVCVDGANNIYFVDDENNCVDKISYRNGTVTTVAGGGASTAYGIPATSALINYPTSICADAAGNVYIVNGNQVERADPVSGNIYAFAGTSSMGYGGDGGPATSAIFNSISGICTDNVGNVYIADQSNERVREVNIATGIVTTIAGTGSAGYTGDGGPATVATLHYPLFICCNSSGDVFFIDQSESRIRKIDASTGIISTYAGGGSNIVGYPALSTYLASPTGMCMDALGNLCWTESSCSCRQINHITDTVNYIAGNYYISGYVDDTNSLYAEMSGPQGMIADGNNNIYIADQGNNFIRKLIWLTHTPTFVFGKGQVITPCSDYGSRYGYPLDSMLWITDIDYLQPETWTVISAPLHGTVAGFPATTLSNGTFTTTHPTGVYYTPSATYSGADSFRVMVSDGVLSDTITIYAQVQPSGPGFYVGPVTGADTLCAGASFTYSDSAQGIGVWSLSNPNATVSDSGVVSALSQGTNTLYFTVNNDCGMYVSAMPVVIDSLPVAGTITAPGSVCAGSAVMLADAIAGGVWSVSNPSASVSGSGVISGISSGGDSVLYAVSNTCGATVASVTITINPLPDAGTITGSDSVCVGQRITLSDRVIGGAWSQSNSSAFVSVSGIVSGVSTGIDTIIYSVTNSWCTAMAKQEVVVGDCDKLGVNNLSSTQPITIFPNPATTDLTITTPPQAYNACTITSAIGRLMMQQPMPSAQTTIDIKTLPPGMYYIMFAGETGSKVEKFEKL